MIDNIDNSGLCNKGINDCNLVSININGINRINNSSISSHKDDLIKENTDTSHIARNEAGIHNRRPSLSLMKAAINIDRNAPSKLDSTLCS